MTALPPGPTAMKAYTCPWGAATVNRALVASSRRSLSTTETRTGARLSGLDLSLVLESENNGDAAMLFTCRDGAEGQSHGVG